VVRPCPSAYFVAQLSVECVYGISVGARFVGARMFLFGRYIPRKCVICGDSAKPGTHYCGDVGCKRLQGYEPVDVKDAIRDTIENYLWESNRVAVSYVPGGYTYGELAVTGHLNSLALADAIVNSLALAKDHPADVKRRAKRLNAWLASLPKHQPRQFIGLP